DISALCEPDSGRLYLRADASLAIAIEMFHAHPEMRLLPVVTDDALRPIGAIVERDVRDLLFNPYGHALLRNPSFGKTLQGYCRPCPIFDLETPLAELLDAYTQAGTSEGLILTVDGTLHGVLANRTLLYLAGRREAELLDIRAARIDSIERSSGI